MDLTVPVTWANSLTPLRYHLHICDTEFVSFVVICADLIGLLWGHRSFHTWVLI